MAGNTTLASLRILVGADVSGATQGLAKVDQSLTKTERTGRNFGVSMGRIGQEVANLGTKIGGLDPWVSKLGTGLGLFAAGGGLTLAVVGGINLIGDAIRSLGEETRAYQEDLDGVAKSLDDLVRKGAFGGKLELLERVNAAKTEISGLRTQRKGPEADLAEAQFWKNQSGIDKAQAAITAIDTEIATWERRLNAAEKALQDAIPALDGLTVTVSKLKDVIGNPYALLRAEREAEVGGRDTAAKEEAARRRRFLIGYKPERITSDGGDGTSGLSNKIEQTFESFTGNLGDILGETFSPENLGRVGAGMAVDLGAQFVSGLVNAFKPVDRLAIALEQNTRALTASDDFLADLLSDAGLTGQATAAEGALKATLNRLVTGTGVWQNGNPYDAGRQPFSLKLTLGEELTKVGLTLDDLRHLADVLGINLDFLTTTTLGQFRDQLDKATDSVTSFTEALRNVPSLFKVSAARFAAANADEVQRSAARGGAFPVQPAFGG